MSPAETIEQTETVKFFNPTHPGDMILVKRDPEAGKLTNPLLAQDKYATFQRGYFETDDPEIIEALQSDKLRAKGVRCMSNPADMAEFGSIEEVQTYIQSEIARGIAEGLEEQRAISAHAAASPFETSPAEAVESVNPKE